MSVEQVTVVGAGLAGSEAAWQLAIRGIPVRLVEMKPGKRTPAHHSADFGELVCSNSLRSDRLENAAGLLKEELRRLGALGLAAADATRVPAGGALAVDREAFSAYITRALESQPCIEIVQQEMERMPDSPCVIATGPLTSDKLAQDIAAQVGDQTLFFFDAAAPIVTRQSLDMDKVFAASRYGRGEDYLNCPMTQEEYYAFVDALLEAKTAQLHEFEVNRVFEGCLPVEVIAMRGRETLAHGPLKPVGLTDPRTGKTPYAVVQLRQDNGAASLYNLVGFQTHLTFPEQKRVFGMIPGLENGEFARYGVMHRNTFLDSPQLLTDQYEMRERENVFFAGQMTGVEGYVESIASGWLAGVTLARRIKGLAPLALDASTATGALGRYISTPNRHFQPMNVNFGIMDAPTERVRGGKKARYAQIAQNALAQMDRIATQLKMEEPVD